jgi:hypothetical protein
MRQIVTAKLFDLAALAIAWLFALLTYVLTVAP